MTEERLSEPHCEFCTLRPTWTFACEPSWIRHVCSRHIAWGKRLFKLDRPGPTMKFWPYGEPDQSFVDLDEGPYEVRLKMPPPEPDGRVPTARVIKDDE